MRLVFGDSKLQHKESGLRYRVYRCVRARRMKCRRGVWKLGPVTALVLAQGIKGYECLFKWLPHGEGTNYKDFARTSDH